MSGVFYFVKRNCLIYFRDKSAVFFSLLSTLIVLGLMVLFLGNANSGQLVRVLAQYGGERDVAMDEKNAESLVQLWTLAGILIVNTVSISLTVLGAMVRDEASKKSMAFYVTPVKRYKISLGYILSAWVVSGIMCLVTLAVGEVYFCLQGNDLLSVKNLAALCGLIFFNTFIYAAIGYILALFIHSNSAWGGMLTIVGTLVGFAGGIYINVGSMSEQVAAALKCLPVLHGAGLMRQACTQEILEKTFAGVPKEVVAVVQEEMGIVISVGEKAFSVEEELAFLSLYAIIAVAVAVLLNRRHRLKE